MHQIIQKSTALSYIERIKQATTLSYSYIHFT